MCQFLSAIVTIEKHPKVLCLDLKNHNETIQLLNRKAETYREFEWTREDSGESLDIRCLPEEDRSEFKSAILAQFPTRKDCLIECIRQMSENGRELDFDLRGCDLKGITLPTGVRAIK